MARPRKSPARYKSHPGSIRRRGETWQIRLKLRGVEYGYTVDGTRADAEEFARVEYKRLHKRLQRQARGLPGRIRFSELLEEFRAWAQVNLKRSTADAYEDSLKVFEVYFCGRDLGGRTTEGPFARVPDPWVDDLITADWTRYLTWRRHHRLGRPLPKAKPGRSRARGGVTPKKSRGVSARTVQKDRAVANRLMTWARKQGYCSSNPILDTDPPEVQERTPVILSEGQFEALLKAAKKSRHPMLRTYLLCLNELGARSESEVLWLRWEDLDLEEGFVEIWSDPRQGHTTKTGRSRHVPMTPRLRDALRQHAARYQAAKYDGQRSEWVFHHVETRRHHRAGDRVKSFRGAFNNAVRRAGLPPEFVQHDLRHRRVTTWVAAGRDIAKIQAAVGHADIRTTLRYTHLVREHLLDLVREREPSGPDLVAQLETLIAQLEKMTK